MKKYIIVLSLMLITLALSNAYSQNPYFNISCGYGLSNNAVPNYYLNEGTYSSSNQIAVFRGSTINSNTFNSVDSFTVQQVHGSLGAGLNLNFSLGCSINKYLSGEFTFSYLPGTSIQSSQTINQTDYTPVDTTYYSRNDSYTLQSANHFRLIPTLKFSIPDVEFSPELKIGILTGFGGSITSVYNDFQNTIVESNGVSTSDTIINNQTLKFTGGFSIGFMASIGIRYKLLDKISAFIELSYINENWAPTKGEVTQYIVNNQDELSGLTAAQKQFNFVDNYSSSRPTVIVNPPPFEIQYLKNYYSFSSLNILLGLRYNFGG